MTKKGMRIVPRGNNSLNNFTPFKSYVVIAGTGDLNLNPLAKFYGHVVLSEEACNVVDDLGEVRFVTMDFFRDLSAEFGVGR